MSITHLSMQDVHVPLANVAQGKQFWKENHADAGGKKSTYIHIDVYRYTFTQKKKCPERDFRPHGPCSCISLKHLSRDQPSAWSTTRGVTSRQEMPAPPAARDAHDSVGAVGKAMCGHFSN